MNEMLMQLEKEGCNVTEGTRRCLDNEQMYLKFLRRFPKEETIVKFTEAMKHKNYEEAYREMHTFKGLTGNLGLTVLYQEAQEMLQLLHAKDYEKAESFTQVMFATYKQLCEIMERL